MISRYIVKGHSMEPAFREGDRLLVSSLFLKLGKGDVVVFNKDGRDYIKRITSVSKDLFVAAGDNKGHGSIHAIARNQIKGKLLMKY